MLSAVGKDILVLDKLRDFVHSLQNLTDDKRQSVLEKQVFCPLVSGSDPSRIESNSMFRLKRYISLS